MATGTLADQVQETRGFIEAEFDLYEKSPTNVEQRRLALHKLNSALFVCGGLLTGNKDYQTYEDLRLKFIGTLFDPLHQSDSAVQEVKAEFYEYLDATAYCTTGNPATSQAP